MPREVLHLNDKGVSIGSYDNPDQKADDELNREVFEESMEIIRGALDNESFAFHGKHFDIPVPGIPDRGSTVQSLTLIPVPTTRTRSGRRSRAHRPSTTCRSSATERSSGTSTYSFIKRFWDKYGETYERTHGTALAPHEKRMLVVATRIEDTYEKARETALPGHDEFWKFLGPYGWSRGYMGEDGKPAKPGRSRRSTTRSRTRRSSWDHQSR